MNRWIEVAITMAFLLALSFMTSAAAAGGGAASQASSQSAIQGDEASSSAHETPQTGGQ